MSPIWRNMGCSKAGGVVRKSMMIDFNRIGDPVIILILKVDLIFPLSINNRKVRQFSIGISLTKPGNTRPQFSIVFLMFKNVFIILLKLTLQILKENISGIETGILNSCQSCKKAFFRSKNITKSVMTPRLDSFRESWNNMYKVVINPIMMNDSIKLRVFEKRVFYNQRSNY